MISEDNGTYLDKILSSPYIEFIEKYPWDREKNSVRIKVKFLGTLYIADITYIYNRLKTIEEFKIKATEQGKEIIRFYINEKGNVYCTLKDEYGEYYDLSMIAYKRVFIAENKFKNALKNNNHEQLSGYHSALGKVLIDFKCGHQPSYMQPNSYLSGERCRHCAKNKTFPYENDCFTIRKDLLPTLSPSDIIQQIKGYTSKILREEFFELSKMPSLWTRSYFVSTAGNVCSETIKKYVENQKKRY